nr:MAG TPA: hypothetical protein [Caudoviricetes sp.]
MKIVRVPMYSSMIVVTLLKSRLCLRIPRAPW